MKTFVRLIISLEKLVKNPVSWFDKQHWLLRMLLVTLIVPLISIVSVVSYDKLSLKNEGIGSQDYCETSTQEIALLRKDLAKFHDSQMEEFSYLSEDIALLKKTSAKEQTSVLGARDSKAEDNLNQKLEDIAMGETETKLVYIKSDVENASVFENSATSSKELAVLEAGSFYPALLEKDDWQQIDLGNNQTGWVEKQFTIKLPINENH